ncbi:sensor histidine kinase [Demequina soli]|uniref:sensor histidine kinase n=1 Tax=Demequina soli TaxID=1638987 RepID=UPI000781F2ED|nr:histidine kinase [Demequina soli]
MDAVLAIAVGAVPCVAGLVVLLHGGSRVIGWLLVAHGVSVGIVLGLPSGATAGAGRLGLVLDQATQGMWTLLFLWVALIAYLLPDGRPGSRRWARWIHIGLAGNVLFWIGAAADREGFAAAHGGVEPPVALPAWLGAVGVLGLVVVTAFLFGAVWAVGWRLRRSGGVERLQLLWVVWGSLSVPTALLLVWAAYLARDQVPAFPFTWVLAIGALGIPVAVSVAIVRHHLLDIRLVLSRTLVYGALIVVALAAYAGILALAGAVLSSSTLAGAIGIAVVAVSMQPAHRWIERRIERWVYGYRSEAQAAWRLLGERAESADPDGLVDAVTAAVADALRAERVSIGPAGTGVALVHRGEHLGDLVVDLPPGRVLDASDRALLGDLARHAAVLVRAEQLNDALRDSRSRLVSGREEERRRLRRDLHDGVGPSLAAILLTLNAAQAKRDGAERDALLAEAREEVRGTIAEVRRVVDGLRPVAIDEVGLVAAVRLRAAALSGEVAFEVDGGGDAPRLPAAVEVAAFRIATEAMTNVARHSGASRCTVAFRAGDALEVTIADNGRGALPGVEDGVGWSSMRERAAELGGTCAIGPRPEGGLLVHAVLPLESARSPEHLVEPRA